MLIFNMYRMKFISIVCFLYFKEAKLKPETKKSDEFEENKTSISTKIERMITQFFSMYTLIYVKNRLGERNLLFSVRIQKYRLKLVSSPRDYSPRDYIVPDYFYTIPDPDEK